MTSKNGERAGSHGFPGGGFTSIHGSFLLIFIQSWWTFHMATIQTLNLIADLEPKTDHEKRRDEDALLQVLAELKEALHRFN